MIFIASATSRFPMTAMIEVKVAELSGAALDYAVAQATKAWEWAHEWFPTMTLDPTFVRVLARECPRGPHGALVMTCLLEPRNPFRQDPQVFSPSTDWSQGGTLIDKHKIDFEWITCATLRAETISGASGFGRNYLEAACRAIVAAKLGEEVRVPVELVQQQGEGGGN